MDVSFVIPCYRSQNTILSVIGEIEQTMAQRPALRYEIICVSDGSPDQVYEVIAARSAQDRHVRGFCLAKNFGQQAAIMAGLNASTGDKVVVLDDDGQTPADESFALLDALDEDNDVVYASYRWAQKMHSRFRNFGTWMNETMLRILLKKPKGLEITSFWAAKRFAIDEICCYTGPYAYTEGLILRSFGRICNVPVRHRARLEGESGYTLTKLLALWLNGFTAFSVVPLRAASLLGVVSAVCGFLYMMYTVIHYFFDRDVPMGYPTLVSLILLLSGVILVMLGLLGEYVGRLYITANRAPQYVVRAACGAKEENGGTSK